MSALNIVRVLALPNPLVANTIYLLSLPANELQVVTVGATIDAVRKTVVKGDVTTMITTALAAISLGTSATLNSDVSARIATAIAAITIDTGSLKTDVASAINAAIAGLDLSNTSLFAANIAARDALVLTKSSFVMVADATGDATVKLGAALYFYNVADDSYTKVSEYESQDLVIPSKEIIEKFTIINGQLAYDGVVVGTVQAGANEW